MPNHSQQHQNSTKQLINRYESLHSRRIAGTPARFFRSISASKENLPIIKSPFRQSFTNLLSAFKIGNTPKTSNSCAEASSVQVKSPASIIPPQQLSRDVARGHLDSNDKQADLYAGTLLYLSRPPDGQRASLILPVWTVCTVKLKHGQVLVTWLTTQGNPSTHTISLTSCTDVRSLSLDQLGPSEMALLPTKAGPEEMRVFEMLFEGRPREKFAASSLQDRARWVTAIWDAILSSQGHSGHIEIAGPQSAPVDVITYDSSCTQERSLPPTPVETPSSLLPSVEKGDTPEKVAPPSVDPSPKINSGQIFAQVDLDNDVSTRNILGKPSIKGSKEHTGRTGLQHQDSVRSDVGYSIIDSYTDIASPILTLMKDQYDPAADNASPETVSPGRSQTTVIERNRYSDVESPASLYPTMTGDPSVKLLRRQSSQLKDATERLSGIQKYLQTFGRHINQLSTTADALADVHHVVKAINLKTDHQKDDLYLLRDKLAGVGVTIQNLQHQVTAQDRCSRDDRLAKMLGDLWDQSRSEFSRIFEALGHIQEAQPDHANTARQEVTMQNLKPSHHSTSGEVHEPHAQCSHALNATCDPMVQEKLEEMLLLLRNLGSSTDPRAAPADLGTFQQTVQELRAALVPLHHEVSHRELRDKQQEDSVRYLNELNSWLEVFVKTSSTQLQETALGVRELCCKLGVDTEPSDLEQQQNGHRTVLGDVQQLVSEIRKRDSDSHDLKQSIDDLVRLIRRNTEDRSGFTPETVMELLNRQRQDQEGLLRALTTELSSEIRGERLRFVEAMKEATAINVQIHVEQFKKELNREVMVMTSEIERLHREKQTVENQIADLFAFYSKHRHPASVSSVQPLSAAHGAPLVRQQSQAHARHPQARTSHQRMPGYHLAS